MKIKVILNGGLKSCCQTYSAEMIKTAVTGWFKDEQDIEIKVVDKQETDIQLDPLALLAEQHFRNKMYPLVYVDDVLASLGSLPDSRVLHKMVENVDRIGISEQDILDAAEKHKTSAEQA